jgi:Protein of unknown function (DUF3822)
MSALTIPEDIVATSVRYQASMHIGAYQLQLALVHLESGEIAYSFEEEYSEQMGFAFDGALQTLTQAWPNTVFHSTTVELEPTEFTLIPENLFDKQNERIYFGNSLGVDQVVLNEKQNSFVLVYAISSKLLALKSLIPGIRFIPTPLLIASSNHTPAENKAHANVFIRGGKHGIHLVKDGKLQLLNFFPGTSMSDTLYFLSNACIQHHITMGNLEVEFFGIVWTEEELAQLRTYIGEVNAPATAEEAAHGVWKLHLVCAS